MRELRKNKVEENAARLQADIDCVVEWCDRWLMKLNVEKLGNQHVSVTRVRV